MADTSILTDIKKLLGIPEDYEAFDVDVTLHINSVFGTLQQLGIGPEEGFEIEDKSATWSDFTNDVHLNTIKTYIYIRVRLVFDPPATAPLLDSLDRQRLELESRLNTYREGYAWTPPISSSLP